MTVYNWLTLFGVPSLFLALVAFIKIQIAQNRAIKNGLKAILRDRLLQAYKHYYDKGYADVDDRSNWENMYQQYHTLGANGVMDDIRSKFLQLPTTPNGIPGENF